MRSIFNTHHHISILDTLPLIPYRIRAETRLWPRPELYKTTAPRAQNSLPQSGAGYAPLKPCLINGAVSAKRRFNRNRHRNFNALGGGHHNGRPAAMRAERLCLRHASFTVTTDMGGSVRIRLPPETVTALKSFTLTVSGLSKVL